MKVKRLLKALPILAFLLLLLSACSLIGGGFSGGRGFTVTADPASGHPGFVATLTATPYTREGKPYGTYVWELPTGTMQTGSDNTISVTVTEGWEAVCYWMDGNTISQRYTIRPSTENTAPAIFHPLKVGGGADKMLREVEPTILYWPVNEELGSCAPSERRGIFDPEGDEVRILCVKIRCLSKGTDDTLYMPPYTVAHDGGMEYHATAMSGQLYENAVLFYPGFTCPDVDFRGRPIAYTGIGGGYTWNSCHQYGSSCDPAGDVVFIYICVEDEYGARNSEIFVWPIDNRSLADGWTPDEHPWNADELDCCGRGEVNDGTGDWTCSDCPDNLNPWDDDPSDGRPDWGHDDGDDGGPDCPTCGD